MKYLHFAAVAVALVAMTSAAPPSRNNGYDKVVMCYFGSWSVYRHGNGKFDVEDIDPFICTHLVFGFAGLDENEYTIKALDPYNELEENYGKGAFKRFTGLKNHNPNLVTLLAIGGWNEGATKYSEMAKTAERRAVFINSCVEMVKEHNFDGLDLDWEYPGGRLDSPGSPDDKANFAHLLREMRTVFDQHGLMMTAAVAAGFETINLAYDIPAMSETLDYIQIMTYDYHGYFEGPGLDKRTGHQSPLHPLPEEESPDADWFGLSTSFSMDYWINNGTRRDQILLGMGTYGRGYRLADPSSAGYMAESTGPCDQEMHTATQGTKGYNEYCEYIYPEVSQWAFTRPDYIVAPYISKGDQWFGYDDIESITTKSEYILQQGYAGGFIWSIETDDFKNLCGDGEFPLLAAIQNTLNGGFQTAPPGYTTPQPDDGGTTDSGSASLPPLPPDTELCNEDMVGSYHQYPGDCSLYYQCLPNGDNWTVVTGECHDPLLFNEEIQACDYAENVDCSDDDGVSQDPTTTTTTITTTASTTSSQGTTTSTAPSSGDELCNADMVGQLHQHPDDCSLFYQCIPHGDVYNVVITPCANQLLFNEGYQVCDYPENVVCV